MHIRLTRLRNFRRHLMRIDRLDIFSFPVPFKIVFRHASASRSKAENIIVAVRSDTGLVGYGEGCPRDYVTGETVASAIQFLKQHNDSILADIATIDDLRNWVEENQSKIDMNPAAFCAVELAILDLLGKSAGIPVEDVIGAPRLTGRYTYSAILGDAPYPVYWWQFYRYRRSGFQDFKIKISGDLSRDLRKLRLFPPQPGNALTIRLDANNLWTRTQDCIAHLKALPGSVLAIEEPLQSGDLSGFREVATACRTRIILDESFLKPEQFEELNDPEQWIINLRVSKMGGLLRAMKVANEAKQRGIRIVVGAQVGETSLLTRAGLVIATAAGDNLFAQEGAFGTHLLRRDLTTPSLMFGHSGKLTPHELIDNDAPGFGLETQEKVLSRPIT